MGACQDLRSRHDVNLPQRSMACPGARTRAAKGSVWKGGPRKTGMQPVKKASARRPLLWLLPGMIRQKCARAMSASSSGRGCVRSAFCAKFASVHATCEVRHHPQLSISSSGPCLRGLGCAGIATASQHTCSHAGIRIMKEDTICLQGEEEKLQGKLGRRIRPLAAQVHLAL